MSRKKEKVSLFEKEVITDSGQAEAIIEKENKKYKFALVCTGLSLFATSMTLLSFTPLAEWAIFDWLEVIFIPLWGAGVVATFLTGPMNILKAVIKVGKISWFVVPVFPLDLVCFLAGMGFALIALVFLPTLYAAYNLYQSYLNKKNAETFLGLIVNTSVTEEKTQTQNTEAPAQIYSCPNCKGSVIYGEPSCKTCGTAFNWNL